MSDTPRDPSSVGSLLDQATDLAAHFVDRVTAAVDVSELDAVVHEAVGKSGEFTALRRRLGSLDIDDRREAGRAINDARADVEAAAAARRAELAGAAAAARLASERIDLTELAKPVRIGHQHLVTATRHELEDIFVGLGFTVEEGPEIESDWFNFQALNTPPEHPARSMWDTLYLDIDGPETMLLRTHTSPVQVRTMMRAAPPIYMVAPGRAYRRDTADATHLPVFHQIEGLVVDRDVSFADLAGTIERFVKAIFGEDRTTRLRPSYFPFTEPSAEFDISTADGGWVELGGCGMVHPNVLAASGLDPEEWSGFAFGFGMDRISMQRHGLDDIREFVVNDIRFLQQF